MARGKYHKNFNCSKFNMLCNCLFFISQTTLFISTQTHTLYETTFSLNIHSHFCKQSLNSTEKYITGKELRAWGGKHPFLVFDLILYSFY